MQKNIRIHFPNGEHEDITNKNVIAESMSFKESLCSRNSLKFGLCEASVFQIETVGVGNIKGCTIEVSLEAIVTYPEVFFTEFDSQATGIEKTTVVKTITGKNNEMAIRFDAPSIQTGYGFTVRIENLDTGEITVTDKSLCMGSYTHKMTIEEGNKIVTINIDNHEVDVESITLVERTDIYPIPLGTFVVDSCTKQNMTGRRVVVAYTREVGWNQISNPLEKQKVYSIGLKQNSPYEFNVAAMVYSNIYKNAEDYYFYDTTVCLDQVRNIQNNIVAAFLSDLRVGDESGNTYKYFAQIIFSSTYCKINSNEEADKLYYTMYADADNVDVYINELKSIINDEKYGWGKGTEEIDLEDIRNRIKHGYYNTGNYDAKSDIYWPTYIPLNGYKYIYPFMNYTESEAKRVYEEMENYYIGFLIPYSAKVKVYEMVPVDTADRFENVVVYESEEISFRYSEWTLFSTIDNLPSLRMSFDRIGTKKNGRMEYHIDATKFNLRNLIEGYCEIKGLMGKNNRRDGLELVSISANKGIYPSESLYPSEELYPNGPSAGFLSRTHYIDAWHDDNVTKSYGSVSAMLKNADGEEVFVTHSIVDETAEDYDASAYQTYLLKNNFVVNNAILTEEELKQILADIAENIKDVRYMPSEITLKGLPYIEAGDFITVITKDSAFETIILNRRLTGIMSLIDTYEARAE